MKIAILSLVFCLGLSVLHAQHDAQRNAVIALAQGDEEAFSKAFANLRVDAGPHETSMVHLLRLLAREEVDASGFQPDALLMLGDNVYIDDPEHVTTQHYCYHRRQSQPGWRSLVSRVPVYSIYDDHDFGDNDCVPGPHIDRPAWKREVWNTFRQNWVNPGYGGGEENPGCWYDFVVGDVHFILLDGRYYRDLKGGSMLGPVQKAWLLGCLAGSEATFKVVASPVPFTPDVKPGSRDPWDGFPEEREEIFSFIENEKIDGVFLIAADRHRTDLRTIAREGGHRYYEFMSSRLTNRHTHPVVETPGLIWGYNETPSFGLMEFDTTEQDPSVTFRCIDIEGNEQAHHTLRLSETTFE